MQVFQDAKSSINSLLSNEWIIWLGKIEQSVTLYSPNLSLSFLHQQYNCSSRQGFAEIKQYQTCVYDECLSQISSSSFGLTHQLHVRHLKTTQYFRVIGRHCHKALLHALGWRELNCSDFLPYRYWAKHSLGAWIAVPLYAYRKQRYALLWECLLSESTYLGIVGLTSHTNPVAALWLLILPYFITSLALMFGNWWDRF